MVRRTSETLAWGLNLDFVSKLVYVPYFLQEIIFYNVVLAMVDDIKVRPPHRYVAIVC